MFISSSRPRSLLYIFSTTAVVAVLSRAWGSMVCGSAARPIVRVRSSAEGVPSGFALGSVAVVPQALSSRHRAIAPAMIFASLFFILFLSFLF